MHCCNMKKTEVLVNLNANEIGILLSALECIERREEIQIEREHGSLNVLHDRLTQFSLSLDLTPTPKAESYVEPSY